MTKFSNRLIWLCACLLTLSITWRLGRDSTVNDWVGVACLAVVFLLLMWIATWKART